MKKALLFLCVLALAYSGYRYYDKYLFRPDLTIIGYVNPADGLGRQPLDLIENLKNDFSISFMKSRHSYFKNVPSNIYPILKRKHKKQGKVIIFEDCLWWPGHKAWKKLKIPQKDDQIRLAYTMCESTRIPANWAIILNNYFDAAIVPDPYFIKIYKKGGVKIPIFCVPLGINLSPFLNEPLKKMPLEGRCFTFANLSSCAPRKNQVRLIQGFAKAFGNNPNVKLLLNARSIQNSYDEEIINELMQLGLKNVEFTIDSLNRTSYIETFKKVDCFVNISKGEGFSIQPREAMALGIPSIISNNTAQQTICQTGLVRPVKSEIQCRALYPWNKYYGHNFDCEIADIANAMKDVYQNYPHYLAKGQEARQWASKYQNSTLKPLYVTLVRPKKILLGDKNEVTVEYLMTTSEELYTKYKNLGASS